MKKLFLAAALIAALVPVFGTRALASLLAADIHVANATDKYVWITVYAAHWAKQWSISKAICLKPNSDWKYVYHDTTDDEVKIRAEVRSGGSCSEGSILSDTFDYRKDLRGYVKLSADMYHHAGRYFIGIR